MGSFSHGIADAIRRMGDAQAQGALQKGAVYGNLAHEIGQAPMNYVALDRGLRTNRHLDTMQAAQEKKLKDDQEFEALINQTPPGPERLKVSLEFWQGRDPEKYHALVAGAYQAATQAVGAQQGRPGEPKMSPDPVSGEPTQIDQQTAHAPVQFPGAYGQEPFSVTPQTDTQVQSAANQQSGLKAFIESKMSALGKTQGEAGKERVYPGGSYVKSPTEEFQVPVAPKTDTSISPYEDFRSGDPTKRKNAKDYLSQSKDPEMVALRKALMQKSLDKPDSSSKGQFVGTTEEGGVKKAVIFKDGAFSTTDLPGGQALGGKTTVAAVANRVVAAKNSLSMGDELIAYLDKPEVKAALGPMMGRVTGWKGLVGNIPPELAELKGIIKSWSELQPAVHGMRSADMAEEIERDAPMHWTPEALKGFIQGFQRTAKTVANSETSGAGTATPAPTGGGGGTNRRISDKSDDELKRILGIQ
jgi:hypothetical protein